ncbi:MAG: fused MFS/spermidine synthase [Mariprofundaceae bacterium]|nr:fused MFS/spermidine synthase [Mariprofundaceae bacterium]
MPNTVFSLDEPHIPDWVLLLTVFITGACVLIIELMGTRILAPYFGSGIYTWSALIAITLAALALGYAFGGRLADRQPLTAILYGICLAAGLWTLATPLLARYILPLLIQIPDIRPGVLISSCILFFPSLFLLGAIGPFVIRLSTQNRESVGSTSGLVFAVSTIGSLLGALGTGFILIPNYGVQVIFTFCGALLVALAMLGNFRLKFIGYAILLTLTVLLFMLLSGKKSNAGVSIRILGQTPSFYGQLQVIQRGTEKLLLVDGIGQNYVFDNNVYSTQYINFIAALPALTESSASKHPAALVIGLGAGQLPMLLQRGGLDVDVVEIDPKIGEMAAKHFGFNLPADQICYMDGRLYFLHNQTAYDFIVTDAFSSEQIASHLLSMEALEETKAHLSETGLLAINITSVKTGEDIAALQHTLQAVFPHVRSFTPDHGAELASFVFVASRAPIHLSTKNSSFDTAQLADVKHFIAGELPDLHSNILLTDDFNPISYQRRDVQLLWRKEMTGYLGRENLEWLLL